MSQKVPQSRLRLRLKDDIKQGTSLMNEEMMKKLTIEAGGKIEVVVTKKKKFSFNVDKRSDIPEREVWLNEEELKEHGISDNTIATIRRLT